VNETGPTCRDCGRRRRSVLSPAWTTKRGVAEEDVSSADLVVRVDLVEKFARLANERLACIDFVPSSSFANEGKLGLGRPVRRDKEARLEERTLFALCVRMLADSFDGVGKDCFSISDWVIVTHSGHLIVQSVVASVTRC
jgi:hypothetical protein